MKNTGFIVLIESYLLRKGVAYLLNQLGGVQILYESRHTRSLASVMQNQAVDYMLITQSLFEASADLFVKHPAWLEKTVLLKPGLPDGPAEKDPGSGTHASIFLGQEREELFQAFRLLVDQESPNENGASAMVLSPRERDIIRLVSMGLTNRQIADRLFLSAHTVITHRKNISSKLGIKSVSGLTVYAIVNNIITIEEVTSLPSQ